MKRPRHLPIPLAICLLVPALSLGTGPASSGAGQAALAATDGSDASARAKLRRDLDTILSDPRLRGAQVGVVVRDATTGAPVYARDAGKRLLPGSNEKLLTTFAALAILGPDHRFKTSVFTHSMDGTVVRGPLYLKGTGDPTLVEASYQELAARVAASGITVVEGPLVADDTWFDDVRLGHDWTWDDEPYSYAAQVSALTVAPNTDDADPDVGSIVVEVGPGEAPGQPARVALVPQTDYVTVDNEATTAAAGSRQDLVVDRAHGTNTLVVTGSVPLGAPPVQSSLSVWNPTGYAAAVFRKALADHGVSIRGSVAFGPTPAGATEVARLESMPLAEILTPLLKLSNNGVAEILVKAIGRATHDAGSWDMGLRGMAERLAATVGLETNTSRIRDGSGLSRQNLVSPMQLSTLLIAAQQQEWFSTWYNALPVAGEADLLVGGTLRSRMTGTAAAGNVHAKTGTLGSVSALSGYVTGARGQRMVFSILLNNYIGTSPKDVEDAIAVALAGFGARTNGAGSSARPGGTKADGGTDTGGRHAGPPPRMPIRIGSRADLDSAVECSWTRSC